MHDDEHNQKIAVLVGMRSPISGRRRLHRIAANQGKKQSLQHLLEKGPSHNLEVGVPPGKAVSPHAIVPVEVVEHVEEEHHFDHQEEGALDNHQPGALRQEHVHQFHNEVERVLAELREEPAQGCLPDHCGVVLYELQQVEVAY